MEKYSIGDKVVIQDFYMANYAAWGKSVEGKEAVVKFCKPFVIYSANIGKDERPAFQARYGIQKEYTVWELHVELEGKLYVVSQLGFSKERRTKFSKISPGVGDRKTDI